VTVLRSRRVVLPDGERPAAVSVHNGRLGPLTPYAGRTLYGVVKTTWLRGEPVNLDGPPRGRLLSRGDA
jgi:allantoinase